MHNSFCSGLLRFPSRTTTGSWFVQNQVSLYWSASLLVRRLVDPKVTSLEATRDLSRTWLHVDMDAFYASVEERDQPSLKQQPMAVGGMGMICTANYLVSMHSVCVPLVNDLAEQTAKHNCSLIQNFILILSDDSSQIALLLGIGCSHSQ